jgi:ubiquinone/menaquinone biosynthesis C-methylase UbiE
MQQDRERKELTMILRYADLLGRDVLEVGCGDGRASAMMAPYAKSLVAIDPDPARLEKAKADNPDIDFRQGSGENQDFPDESFDIVAFTFSLHHHRDIAKALEEAHRVLRPGGQVLIVEPSAEGEMHRFFSVFRDEDSRLAEARRAIKCSGLRIGGSETFSLEWTFDDAEDLYSYFFEENRTARTPELVRKMDLLLGEKRSDKPILLSENVMIFSLRKVEAPQS